MDALLFFKSKGEIVTSEYMNRYDVTDRTVRRNLLELAERGILVKKGELKGSKYMYQ